MMLQNPLWKLAVATTSLSPSPVHVAIGEESNGSPLENAVPSFRARCWPSIDTDGGSPAREIPPWAGLVRFSNQRFLAIAVQHVLVAIPVHVRQLDAMIQLNRSSILRFVPVRWCRAAGIRSEVGAKENHTPFTLGHSTTTARRHRHKVYGGCRKVRTLGDRSAVGL